jgi:hypothetical protein
MFVSFGKMVILFKECLRDSKVRHQHRRADKLLNTSWKSTYLMSKLQNIDNFHLKYFTVYSETGKQSL